MKGADMFSRPKTRSNLILALLSVGIFSLAACENESDVTSPLETDTQIQAAGLWLPAADVMVTTTSANEGQEKGLREARGRWGAEESGSPMQGFLLEASSFLSDEQLVQLVNLIAEQREARQQQGVESDAPRHGRRGQRGMRQGQGPHAGILGYADELGLTEDQVAALTALHEELKGEFQGMRGERGRRGRGQGPTEEQRAKGEEIREAHQANVREILTDEQWTKLEEIRQQGREERREARQEQRTERQEENLDFLAEILDLSDEQRASIEGVLDGQHEKMQALGEEFRESLGEERPTAEQMEAHRAAMEALRTETHTAVLELLDEDQGALFEALKKLRAQHPRGRR